MKTTLIKNFLKNNFQTIIVGIIVLIVCIFGIVKTYESIQDKKIRNVNTSDLRQSIIDSVKSTVNAEKLAEIDSVKAKEYHKTQQAISKVLYYKNIAKNKDKSISNLKNKTDSLAKLQPGCTDIVNGYEDIIDTLEQKICDLDSVNYYLDKEAESYSTRLYLTEKQNKILVGEVFRKDSVITEKSNYIELLEKKNKRPTFWNGLKIGFISGYASGIGTAILIKR